ncbi:MAG: hypothetical protein ACRBB0_20590 [Pelagimonas sp.]|uniref:hypothetical protein n=1 Tax=Pelagimonas sp. TaxID=2073170 RepID=UPI003D6B875C
MEELHDAHWVGSQPNLIQSDLHHTPEWPELDRVVLLLGFDVDLVLGNADIQNVIAAS